MEIYQHQHLVCNAASEIKARRYGAKRTYSLEVAFCDFNGGSVDCNGGKDSTDGDQELSGEHR